MARCAGYCRVARYRFESYLDQMGIDLEGRILDVACGPVSLACLYDDVWGHDHSPSFVEDLAERGVPARLADITELDYPSGSFSYVVSFNPPMKPFRRRGDVRVEVRRFVEEMLRISRKMVIIRSGPMMDHLPPECDHLVERRGRNYVVYRAGDGGSNSSGGTNFPLCEPSQLAFGCRS
ncbi:MAG: class I SAM-dependent methyltransferase [Methanothrix sp.]